MGSVSASNWEQLGRLRHALPPQDVWSGAADIELRARAVLRLVVEPVAGSAQTLTPDADPTGCPNCGAVVQSMRSPYCGEACREMAGFVRQFRTGLAEGWIFDSEKQVALGQVLWHVLGGGRPLRREIAPAHARKAALKRENGRCQVCGAEATTVDHIGSGCNRPINLRAVCDACCADRSFGDRTVMVLPQFQIAIAEIAVRIASPEPLRRCDDAATWNWRDYVRRRQASPNPVGE